MANTGHGRVVHLQLICVDPPGSAGGTSPQVFGLQDKKQDIHPGTPQADGSILYSIDIAVSPLSEGNKVRFKSPFVHGTPAAPFLYLSLKSTVPGEERWIRRLKVPLAGLTWDRLEHLPEPASFVARVSGTGSGTVPLLDGGWIPQAATQHAL